MTAAVTAAARVAAPAAPAAAPTLLQRACACGGSAGLDGKCAGCETRERLGASLLQPKLAVSAPDDPYEREADAVAERVMRMPAAGAGPLSVRPLVQRETAVPEPAAPAGFAAALASASGGAALPTAARAFFEPRFGRDLGHVRIHDGASAAAMARGIHARAFTAGRDIYFAPGAYDPASGAGRRLLAHELTHIVQQGDRSGGMIQRAPEPAQPEEIELPPLYVGNVPEGDPAERARIRQRRQRTYRHFALIRDHDLQEAYARALQAYLNDGMEAGNYRDLEAIEQVIDERAPNAPWRERVRRDFEARRDALLLAEDRARRLPNLSNYWQNQFGALAGQMRTWPDGMQDYATDLLWKWHETAKRHVFKPALQEKAVFDDIAGEYEQVLRESDRAIQKECRRNPPGTLMKIHGDPCRPWFAGSWARGEQYLHEFKVRMRIYRDEDGTPYKTVAYWVEEFMKYADAVPTQMGSVHLEILGSWATVQNSLSGAAGGGKVRPSRGASSAPRIPPARVRKFPAPSVKPPAMPAAGRAASARAATADAAKASRPATAPRAAPSPRTEPRPAPARRPAPAKQAQPGRKAAAQQRPRQAEAKAAPKTKPAKSKDTQPGLHEAAAAAVNLGKAKQVKPGACPSLPPGEQVRLKLPPQKVVHAPRYQSLLFQHLLQHRVSRDRATKQSRTWDRMMRGGEMQGGVYYKGVQMGLCDRQILRPSWTASTLWKLGTQVDHVIEFQVSPIGQESMIDKPWNYEMMDQSSNGSSGTTLRNNIAEERARLVSVTGDSAWAICDLTFTTLVLPPPAEAARWSLQEVGDGDHLDAFEKLGLDPEEVCP